MAKHSFPCRGPDRRAQRGVLCRLCLPACEIGCGSEPPMAWNGSTTRSSDGPGWCASSKNREACLRLATALCAEQSDECVIGKRYLDTGELRQWQRDRAPNEVALAAI